MDVMVITSERVCDVMVVLGFTEGAVGVEEGTKSDDKGSGWCVTGAAEQVWQTLRLPDQ